MRRMHDELDEVAEVQRGRARVEAAIQREGSLRECFAQRRLVGGLCHQAAPLQLVEDVRHGYRCPLGPGGLPAHPDTACRMPPRAGPPSTARSRMAGVTGAGGRRPGGRPRRSGRRRPRSATGMPSPSPPGPLTPTRGPTRTRSGVGGLALGDDEVDGLADRRAAEVETGVLLGHRERLPEPTRAPRPVALTHRPAPGPDEVVAGHHLTRRARARPRPTPPRRRRG